MNNEDLTLIKAELTVLFKRIKDLEHSVNGGFEAKSLKHYYSELEKEALKIIDQI